MTDIIRTTARPTTQLSTRPALVERETAPQTIGDGPLLVRTRSFPLWKGSKPGELMTTTLEDIRDRLRAMRDRQDPRDFDRSLSHVHVSYEGGRVTARFIGPNGLTGPKMLVHDNAYRQMSTTILPARFGSGLLQTADLSPSGEKVATMSWALWSRSGRDASDKPCKLRTVLTRDVDGQIQRMIRSQVSPSFAAYDNLDFVQSLLDNAPELAAMPVIDLNISDTGMRLRFCTEPVERFDLNKAMPIMEARNSEVGRGSTVLLAGVWKLICTNGMQSWDTQSEFRWRHFGDTERINGGVASAIEQLKTEASGVVAAYNQALDVAIDDAFAYLARELKREKLTKEQIKAAQEALNHETTTPGGCLASAVDATTLIAQNYDLHTQSEIERAAARMMRRGQAEALRTDGRIRVAV
jgi:hypothetical protein